MGARPAERRPPGSAATYGVEVTTGPLGQGIAMPWAWPFCGESPWPRCTPSRFDW